MRPSGSPLPEFTDDLFPPSPCSLGAQAEEGGAGATSRDERSDESAATTSTTANLPAYEWARARELLPGAPLVVEGVRYGQVVQGRLPNCFLMAALAAVATKPKLLQSLVREGGRPGEYVVTIFQRGRCEQISVDDYLPVTTTGKLAFAHTRNDTPQLAFSLIEKGFAKMYGSYAASRGGSTAEALHNLTGAAVDSLNLTKMKGADAQAAVKSALKRGDLAAVGHIDTAQRGEFTRIELGLRRNHAYAVIKATAQSLLVYNPMGHDDGFQGKSNGQGTYTLQWSEALRVFNRAQIARVSSATRLPTLSPRWEHSWNSSWGTAGGCSSSPGFRTNPALALALTGKEGQEVEVVLGQADMRSAGGGALIDYPQLGITVLEMKDGKSLPLVTPGNYQVVATSTFWNNREVSLSFTAPSKQLVIVPSTYESGVDAEFWMRMRTVAPVKSAKWHSFAHDFVSATWTGSAAANGTHIDCTVAMPGSRVLVFLRQTQAEQVPIGVCVLESDGGEQLSKLKAPEFVKASEVSIEFKLPKDSKTCTLVPCTFKPDMSAEFTLQVATASAHGIAPALAAGSGPNPLAAGGAKAKRVVRKRVVVAEQSTLGPARSSSGARSGLARSISGLASGAAAAKPAPAPKAAKGKPATGGAGRAAKRGAKQAKSGTAAASMAGLQGLYSAMEGL